MTNRFPGWSAEPRPPWSPAASTEGPTAGEDHETSTRSRDLHLRLARRDAFVACSVRSMKPLTHVLCLAGISLGACGDNTEQPPGPPEREVDGVVTVDASGFSEPFTFEVPEGTRSITIVAVGGDGLYALGSFEAADGAELVGIDLATAPGPAMRASYDTEQIGQMAGRLYQTIRLGTFAHVYPYRPDQMLVAGTTALRIASDTPGPVRVTVLMPEDDGGKTLHLNLIAVSESLTITDPPTFVDELQGIFTPIGIQVAVDDIVELRGTGLSSITDFNEPQESPTSMSAQLTTLADGASPKALDVFFVDSLPSGVAGLSLGTPGPPIRGSYYYGVVIRTGSVDAQLARVIAHELSHFLALQHVTNVGVSGAIYPDPLDDTQPNQNNLMQNGTVLTPDQSFSLSRSALLQVQ